jgi:hypothetical protein
MTIAMILEAINGLISIGFNLYKMMQQIKGDEPIPTWEEILTQNITLQAKIDAEKEAL